LKYVLPTYERFLIIYSFRLYIAFLGKVWSVENNKSTITCPENKHRCVIINVYNNIDKYCYALKDYWSSEVLEFKNSTFERFPAPECIPRYFYYLESLQASDCGMSELGDTFMKNSTNNEMWYLKTVDFSRNRLSKVEPLDRLPYLQYLNLSSNRIEELHNESFAGLEHLRILDLGSNNISKIDPETFSTVINLKEVILADNKLTKLPNNMFLLQSVLVAIDLAHNHLTTFDFSTVGNTEDLKSINLACNNIQSLQNLTILGPYKTIDVTDNQWNCLYAQILGEIAIRRNYKLIGNIFNCSINLLDSTTNKKFEEQKKNITNFGERLNTSLERFDIEIMKLNQTLDEQAEKINMIEINFIQKNSEMLEIITNTKAELKSYFEEYNKGKANIDPWIIIVILMATTIMTAIAGAFAGSFVKKYRSQYKF
jgi:preprotein translocase subunit Sec61beta